MSVNNSAADSKHPKKVLFIGNIANNAYNNAKILRTHGIEVDVLCYDYYHIMGCPEWEDADLSEIPKDQFFPRWKFSEENTFTRPDWFFQGPMLACLDAIFQKNSIGHIRLTTRVRISFVRFICSSQMKFDLARSIYRGFFAPLRRAKQLLYSFAKRLFSLTASLIDLSTLLLLTLLQAPVSVFALIVVLVIRRRRAGTINGRVGSMLKSTFLSELLDRREKLRSFIRQGLNAMFGENVTSPFETNYKKHVKDLVDFARDQVDVQYLLKENDLLQYQGVIERWARVLKQYDKVVGFSTDGVYPLLCGVPYVAFEHGTIRNIPWAPTVQGAICNLVYRKATHVIVTNCDNNVAGDRLCPGRYTYIPHPINEWVPDSREVEILRSKLTGGDNEKTIIFAPARHDWDEDKRDSDWEKGNDLLIKAAAHIVGQGNELLLIFVNFGRCIDKSKALIESLGLGSSVVWIDPVHHRLLMQYLAASDLIADQFNNPSFGGIPGKAWILDRAVINAYDRGMHDWCFFDDHPPIIECQGNLESITSALNVIRNKDALKKIGLESKAWYARQHSNDVICTRLIRVLFGESVTKS